MATASEPSAADSPPPAGPRPRRRWLQYGLRSLFVLTAICAGSAPRITLSGEPGVAQEERLKDPAVIAEFVKQLSDKSFSVREMAEQELNKAGREAFSALIALADKELIGNDADVRARRILDRIETPVSDAAVEKLRAAGARVQIDRSSGRPVSISFRDTPHVTNDTLERISDLRFLTNVELSATEIDDDGLVHLENLKRLIHVSIRHSKITDHALIHMRHLSRLQDLDLQDVDCEGDGFDHVRNLTELHDVGLSRAKLSEKALESLAKCKQVRRLSMVGSNITNRETKLIAAMTGLEYLNLTLNPLTSKDIEPLAALSQLRYFTLGTTHIDDGAAETLLKMPTLARIGISHTKMTFVGVFRLRELKDLESLNCEGLGITVEQYQQFMNEKPIRTFLFKEVPQ